MEFIVKDHEDFTLIEVKCEIITPEELREINPPQVLLSKGVVLYGRAPIWLYGMLVHHYHPSAWVGIYDPRLNGAVVVQTHKTGISIGDIIIYGG